MKIIQVYTDASFIPYSNCFGIGIHIIDENNNEHTYGRTIYDTDMIGLCTSLAIHIAEMYAIYQALRLIDYHNSHIHIYTDNNMVYDSLNSKKSCTNKFKDSEIFDLTKSEIIQKSRYNNISIRWIPAHNDIYGNEICDKIAKHHNKIPYFKKDIRKRASNIYNRTKNASHIDNWLLAEKQLMRENVCVNKRIHIKDNLFVKCNSLNI